MYITKPRPPRLVVLVLACLQAFSLASGLAVETDPIVNDRVEGSIVRDSEVSVDVKKKTGWKLQAVISAAYDDNIYLSRNDAKSDQVYRVGPVISYSKGDADEKLGAFIQLAYNPTAVFYGKAKDENRIDQQAGVTLGWRGKATVLTYEGSAVKTADATGDVGSKTDRLETLNRVKAVWTPREKNSLEVSAAHSQTNYDDKKLYDSANTYGEVAWQYAYSPKTRAGIAYRLSHLEVDNSKEQIANQVTGRLEWQPREKIRVQLEAGAESRKSENGTNVNPVVNGRIDWQPRVGTGFYLTAYQREVASAYLAGQNYRLTGFTAGVSQQVGQRWTAKFEGGREQASYTQVSGTGDGGREDRIWFIRPALEYKFTDKLNIEAFYRISKNQSNQASLGYDQDIAGIQLNYQF